MQIYVIALVDMQNTSCKAFVHLQPLEDLASVQNHIKMTVCKISLLRQSSTPGLCEILCLVDGMHASAACHCTS